MALLALSSQDVTSNCLHVGGGSAGDCGGDSGGDVENGGDNDEITELSGIIDIVAIRALAQPREPALPATTTFNTQQGRMRLPRIEPIKIALRP